MVFLFHVDAVCRLLWSRSVGALVFFLHNKQAIQETVKMCFPAGGEDHTGLER